jgi:hypothetical protein
MKKLTIAILCTLSSFTYASSLEGQMRNVARKVAGACASSGNPGDNFYITVSGLSYNKSIVVFDWRVKTSGLEGKAAFEYEDSLKPTRVHCLQSVD